MDWRVMMKILLLTFLILLINGCSQKIPDCNPQPCVKNYPELPVYKTPFKKSMTEPTNIGGGMYAVVGTELRDCLKTNKKLRYICNKYRLGHIKINKVYK